MITSGPGHVRAPLKITDRPLWQPLVGLALALALVLTTMVGLGGSAEAQGTSLPKLLVSQMADRSGSVLLADATVAGDAFVHVSGSDIRSVKFFVDDADMKGRATHVERHAPFDLAGTAKSGDAQAWDTTSLSEGRHTLTARIDLRNSADMTITAPFTVANDATAADVLLSSKADRSGATALDGATVTGDAYVFAQVPESVTAKSVTFEVAGADGAVHSLSEWSAPYDLNGTASDGGAVAWDTTGLADGSYTATVTVNTSTSSTPVKASFQVKNAASAPAPAPEPAPEPAPQPEPEPEPAPAPAPDAAYDVSYSSDADRSPKAPLSGATVSGDVHAFLDVPSAGDISKVAFSVAGSSGTVLSHTEWGFPYDMNGSGSSDALAWDTTKVANGSYTATVTVTAGSGTETVKVPFTIENAGSSTSSVPTDGGGTTPPADDPAPEPAPAPAADDGSRQSLLDRRVGFGRNAGNGSLSWTEVVVTNLNNSGSGSLREALSSGSRWITFKPGLSGTINVGSTLSVPSNIVIDGRGADVKISGDTGTQLITIKDSDNVIITNLKLGSGEDGIYIRNRATDIWIDHITAGRVRDEVFAFTGDGSSGNRPERITVSYTRVDGAGKVMLLGSTATNINNAPDNVTLHHNHWSRSTERHPLVRYAKVHAYNNWIDSWGSSGSGQGVRVGANAQFYSEANIYDDKYGRPALVAENLGTYGYTKSVNDVVTGNPQFEQRQPEKVFTPSTQYSYRADAAGQGLRDHLSANAGWQG